MNSCDIVQKKRQNLNNTLKIIATIVSAVSTEQIKGSGRGILVFFKSYELMYDFYRGFKEGDYHKMFENVPFFCEKQINT